MYIDFLENQPLVTLGLSSSHGESQLDVTGSHPGTEDQPFGVPPSPPFPIASLLLTPTL